ncbi:MAG TPA: VWA domain-containing protein [Actinomycetales bacterium]|nr:VWA domain-containing protein [Actinomycetales bacterium]
MTATATPSGVDVALAGFVRALRSAGLGVSTQSTQSFLQAVAEVGAGDGAGVYWSGRATLCHDPDGRAVYDRVFEAWFAGRLARPGRPTPVRRPHVAASLGQTPSGPGAERDPERVRADASGTEVLRHRDVADLTAAERAELARLFAGLQVHLPQRRAARRRGARRGDLDARATVREQLRRGGEVGPLRWRRRTARPRRVVLLVDVSGSMTPYADALLRLGHLLVRASVADGNRVEVFSIGTRLTRLTPALRRTRDPDAALRLAGEQVPDWSGGTRLGEVLRAFTDRWGQRGMARGAVLVVCSDGWERGDSALLGEQAQRLARLTHRLVWLNPHRGKDGYRPVQAGIAAVVPHVDDLVAGHSLATFAELLELVRGA